MFVENSESSPPLKSRRIDDPVAVLKSHWTYHDVLWAAIATLPEGTNRLTADALRWCEVIAQVKTELAPEDRLLLAKIHFDRRPGAVYSSEVRGFTTSLVDLYWRPVDNTFEIPEDVKKEKRLVSLDKLKEHQKGLDWISQHLQTLAV